MDNFDESSILKPGKYSSCFLRVFWRRHFLIGMRIKPEVDDTSAKEIAWRVYGIKALEICVLNSYDDKNFLIFADK